MTTTGNTMECSANRNSARGSDSSTEVSNTYVRSACAADVGVDVAGFTRARLAECSTLAVSSEVTIAPTSELYSDPSSASDTLHPPGGHEPTRPGAVPDDLDATTAPQKCLQRHATKGIVVIRFSRREPARHRSGPAWHQRRPA